MVLQRHQNLIVDARFKVVIPYTPLLPDELT
jgi:hypothetical protein